MSKEEINTHIKKIGAVGGVLADEFVGKDDIITMMLVCAIAQEPMVIFGEPGTAKSALITRFCDLLKITTDDASGDSQDHKLFKYLLTPFTEPDELLGVVDIDAYLHGVEVENKDAKKTDTLPKERSFRRITKGGIQESTVIFLDEIFRANSAILNTLLSIINERVYYEGGKANDVQARIIYGASNDVPVGSQEIKAFYSRFPIRTLSESIIRMGGQPEKSNDLLNKGWKLEVITLSKRSGKPKKDKNLKLVEEVSFGDLVACQDYLWEYWDPDNKNWGSEANQAEKEKAANQPVLRNIDYSKAPIQYIKEAYLELIRELNDKGPDLFQIDDRKAIRLFKVILAHAMLNNKERGKDVEMMPTMDDVAAVLYHAWQNPVLANRAKKIVDDAISNVETREDINIPDLLKRLRSHQ